MRSLTLFFLPVSLFLVSCSNNASTVSEKEEPGDTVETAKDMGVHLQQHFPKLFAFFQQQDTSFPMKGFEGGELEQKDIPASTPIDTAHSQPYWSYLAFNKDSSKTIDYVSYNYILENRSGRNRLEQGGPDSEVAILDLKQHSRQRIL